MKAFLFAVILSAATFTFAEEPAQAPTSGTDSSDVVGTIQEPSQQNKKIIKKIMTRKEKGSAHAEHAKKKHHGKNSPAKTEAAPETK